MKKLTAAIILFLLCSCSLYSQNASEYFPSSTGYKWYFKNTPLDSMNNPQSNLATYQVDSFSVVETYQGLLSSVVLSKSGLSNVNQTAPYSDTSHYNFQSTNAYYYLNVLGIIGSIPGLDTVAFYAFLRSFETWYNTYRFSQTVNTNYTIFSRDTTITIDTLVLPLRLSATGRRYNDQNVSTVNGTYTAKKFLITATLSYLLTIPPFPTVAIPIVTRPDTVYIASGIWTIKDVIPSVNVDLSTIGFPVSFSIPGNVRELTSPSVGISGNINSVPSDYSLSQNYPNPFNPSTKIGYSVPHTGEVTIKIYNLLGTKIKTLVSGIQQKGSYEIEFNASDLASGIYYYRMQSDNFSDTKQMILLK